VSLVRLGQASCRDKAPVHYSEDGDTRLSLVETAFRRTYRVTSFDQFFSLMFHIAQSFQLSCLVIVSIFRDWNSQIWAYLTEMKCLPQEQFHSGFLSTTYFFSSHEITRSLHFPTEPTIFSESLEFIMCFTLIRAALLADRFHRRQQAKEARATAEQKQQYQYANPAALYTVDGTTGIASTDKPHQPQPAIPQIA
jgi:hypothetical protein